MLGSRLSHPGSFQVSISGRGGQPTVADRCFGSAQCAISTVGIGQNLSAQRAPLASMRLQSASKELSSHVLALFSHPDKGHALAHRSRL